MNIFVVYDQSGNILQATDSDYPQLTPPQQMLVLASGDPNGQAVMAQPKNYMVQNGHIIPAVTLQLNRTSTFTAPWNTYSIAIVANDGGQHSVNMSVLGYTQTFNTGDTIQVAVHQAISSDIEVVVSGQGVITNHTSLSTGVSTMQLQTYKDANGLLHIAPVQKNDLVAFYTGVIPQELSTADLTTSDSLLMQTVFGIILPALTSGTTPLVTLDANQANALADIQQNVLPSIVTTLEDAAPVPASGQAQSFDVHYGSYRRDLAIAKTAFDQYVADVTSIPNLV